MNNTDDRDTTPLDWLEGLLWGALLGCILTGAVWLHHAVSYGWGLR